MRPAATAIAATPPPTAPPIHVNSVQFETSFGGLPAMAPTLEWDAPSAATGAVEDDVDDVDGFAAVSPSAYT